MPVMKFNFEDINANKFEETALWENPNPGSAYQQGQTITLSDDLTNYDMICIAYKPFLSVNEDIVKEYFPMNQFLDSRVSDYPMPVLSCNHGTAASPGLYYRYLSYLGSRTVSFGACYYSTSANNALCVPITIYGVNIK